MVRFPELEDRRPILSELSGTGTSGNFTLAHMSLSTADCLLGKCSTEISWLSGISSYDGWCFKTLRGWAEGFAVFFSAFDGVSDGLVIFFVFVASPLDSKLALSRFRWRCCFSICFCSSSCTEPILSSVGLGLNTGLVRGVGRCGRGFMTGVWSGDDLVGLVLESPGPSVPSVARVVGVSSSISA